MFLLYTKKRKRTFVRLQNEKGENKNLTKKAENLTHFTSDDVLARQAVVFDFSEDSIENESEYIERRRERAMFGTVREIIENELDEIKRDIFVSMFFNGEKPTDVAKRLSMAVSTVYKHYRCALSTLEKSLKYVIYYCKACHDKLIPLGDMQKRARQSSESVYITALPMRLKRLMQRDNVSVDSMCGFSGVQKVRLEKILGGKITANADEIVLFSGFFGVSADYILKGDLT